LQRRVTRESVDAVVAYLKSNLSTAIFEHVSSTRDFALKLNSRQNLGLDEWNLSAASLLHDIAREYSDEELRFGLMKYDVEPGNFNFVVPMLLHGELGAIIAEKELGIDDREIIDAIRKHATGSGEMSLFDKVIYVADKVEPRRDYPGVEVLRALALEDVRKAYPVVLSSVLKYLIDGNHPLDYNSIEAYNAAIKADLNPKGS
jgi:predicted HD superfamily hydrolase involved in NAD metabolism